MLSLSFFRRIARTATGTAALCCLAASVSAQTPSPGAGADAKFTLRPIDGDGDGAITRAEWNVFTQSFYDRDKNDDAAIDAAELLPAETARGETPFILFLADTDGNGKLTRPEWTQMMRGFARLDADRNGTLTESEFAAAVESRQESMKPGGAASNTPGLWRGYIVNGRGQNPNSGSPIELLISGNRIAGHEAGKPGAAPNLGVGTFAMSGNSKAGFLDAQYVEGPQSGVVCLGIFRMEGDTLHWCASNRDGYRPTEFNTANGCWYMIVKRVEQPAAGK
jgi:uncharacterized protein (TIGR03067 family)